MSDYDRDRIDVAVARRLVDSQFPRVVGAADQPRSRSTAGTTARSGSGQSSASGCRPGSWYAQQVEKEQRWLPELAPQLPLPIPAPVAHGAPDGDYPFPWSVYRLARRRARRHGRSPT